MAVLEATMVLPRETSQEYLVLLPRGDVGKGKGTWRMRVDPQDLSSSQRAMGSLSGHSPLTWRRHDQTAGTAVYREGLSQAV